MAKRAREAYQANSGQEIGPPPDRPPELQAEWEACRKSLRTFLLTVCPEAFPLEFSDDHERLISKIESTIIEGGLFALAMPRGNGKTTIIIRAAIWAIVNAYRRFVAIVCSTDDKAKDLLKGIQTELEFNPKLRELYPKEMHCLAALAGESRRCNGQRINGDRTLVEWKHDRVGFGYCPGSAAAGSFISTCGLTGNIRGQFVTLPSGEILRPDIAMVDDPQTRESAKSEQQCIDRHAIMMGDVLGMSGPDKSLSGFCTCTVVYEGDLSDRLLDRQASPVWRGDKCQLVYKWPKNEDLWDEYRAIYEEDLRNDGDDTRAIEFVQKNHQALHDGAIVAWEQRKTEREVSALHHAYNLRIKDEPAFFAEYQNDPLSAAVEIPFKINAEEVSRRIVSFGRHVIPDECEKVTAFVDVQKQILYYTVTAWTLDGRGHVIDYGTFPEQKRLHFHKRDVSKGPNTLSKRSGADNLNEALYWGLETLTDRLLSQDFKRTDSTLFRIARIGIDAGWAFSTRVVRRFARESQFRGRITPMMGRFQSPSGQLWHEKTVPKGGVAGVHFMVTPPPSNEAGVPEIKVDANWWKSFVAERLTCEKGANKSIVLFNGKPHQHRMFAEHCASERCEVEEGKNGNRVILWKQDVAGLDNDYFDCLVGCSVLAGAEGVRVHVKSPVRRQKKTTKKKPQLNLPGGNRGGNNLFFNGG